MTEKNSNRENEQKLQRLRAHCSRWKKEQVERGNVQIKKHFLRNSKYYRFLEGVGCMPSGVLKRVKLFE